MRRRPRNPAPLAHLSLSVDMTMRLLLDVIRHRPGPHVPVYVFVSDGYVYPLRECRRTCEIWEMERPNELMGVYRPSGLDESALRDDIEMWRQQFMTGTTAFDRMRTILRTNRAENPHVEADDEASKQPTES